MSFLVLLKSVLERQNIIENLKECCKLEGTLYEKFTEEYIGLNI